MAWVVTEAWVVAMVVVVMEATEALEVTEEECMEVLEWVVLFQNISGRYGMMRGGNGNSQFDKTMEYLDSLGYAVNSLCQIA